MKYSRVKMATQTMSGKSSLKVIEIHLTCNVDSCQQERVGLLPTVLGLGVLHGGEDEGQCGDSDNKQRGHGVVLSRVAGPRLLHEIPDVGPV